MSLSIQQKPSLPVINPKVYLNNMVQLQFVFQEASAEYYYNQMQSQRLLLCHIHEEHHDEWEEL